MAKKKFTRAEMVEFITNIVMDCSQVPLDSFCGKYFNLMWFEDGRIMVESFEKNNTYDFTNINDLSDKDVANIYKSVCVDFS